MLKYMAFATECDQAVKQLEEQVGGPTGGACADLLILPLYAAMPLELQVCITSPSALRVGLRECTAA